MINLHEINNDGVIAGFKPAVTGNATSFTGVRLSPDEDMTFTYEPEKLDFSSYSEAEEHALNNGYSVGPKPLYASITVEENDSFSIVCEGLNVIGFRSMDEAATWYNSNGFGFLKPENESITKTFDPCVCNGTVDALKKVKMCVSADTLRQIARDIEYIENHKFESDIELRVASEVRGFQLDRRN